MFSTSRQWFARRRQTAQANHALHTRTDADLAYRLVEIFERDLSLAGVQGIHFYVQNGTVTLYGALRHALDRDLLVSLVRKIDGVEDVVEHIQFTNQRLQDRPPELPPSLPHPVAFTASSSAKS